MICGVAHRLPDFRVVSVARRGAQCASYARLIAAFERCCHLQAQRRGIKFAWRALTGAVAIAARVGEFNQAGCQLI
jgi:hypothetical protein